MKVLILGSKGFLGQHCVRHFSELKDVEVFMCDVIVDYNSNNYFLLDAGNPSYSELFLRHQFDVCINCSGAASVQDSVQHPQRDFTLNVFNVFRQLEAIRKFNPTCKFINLSSAAVYGNPDTLPIEENTNLAPISPYGKHKLMAEQICQEFHDNFGIATLSLRVFSAYGPGLKKQLFWDLHKKYKYISESIELHGSGLESRDFIYVDDLINLIDLIVRKAIFDGRALNACNGNEILIKDVVELYYQHMDETPPFHFNGVVRKGDPNNWCGDITEIKKLGYRQLVSIDEGVKRYFEWANENA